MKKKHQENEYQENVIKLKEKYFRIEFCLFHKLNMSLGNKIRFWRL